MEGRFLMMGVKNKKFFISNESLIEKSWKTSLLEGDYVYWLVKSQCNNVSNIYVLCFTPMCCKN